MAKRNKVFRIDRPGQYINFEMEMPNGTDRAERVTVQPTVKQGAAQLTYFGSGTGGLSPESIQVLESADRYKSDHRQVVFSPNMERMYYAYPAIWGNVAAIIDQNGFNVTGGFSVREEVFDLPDGTQENYLVYEGTDYTTLSNFKLDFIFS